ncbi:MAG: M4 family metallopeptidase [Gammaproteobacteria bacterium]|nr:M4 family metallopeptidase [Gammaproteobacteria bacterium]MBU1655048.1 M4 family metallopeptidase [Gammaproteobacteria bacterium]MBU1961545.1 M4 family metallopeptidase [Gammaproteobacteria bacterium]
MAHELTHGVTQHTSKLLYKNLSGAINESFSDLWGEFVDLGNNSGTDSAASRWLIGEDLSAPNVSSPLRNMKDPTFFKQPDKVSSEYFYSGEEEGNGGVHTNSGINNKAVYLMVDGDTFNGITVKGIGITKTAKIYYDVQTNLLTQAADYQTLYNALYQGCQNLVRDHASGITAGIRSLPLPLGGGWGEGDRGYCLEFIRSPSPQPSPTGGGG